PFVWSFTVADTVPGAPTVTSVTPAAGAVSVAANVVVTAAFSGPMDSSTLTSSTFTLTGPAGALPASVTYDPTSNKATLDPTGSLSPATPYPAALTSAVRGKDGTPCGGLSWGFTTIAAPTITSY